MMCNITVRPAFEQTHWQNNPIFPKSNKKPIKISPIRKIHLNKQSQNPRFFSKQKKRIKIFLFLELI